MSLMAKLGRQNVCIFHFLLLSSICFHDSGAMSAGDAGLSDGQMMKVEVGTSTTTMSPPEGNTTFLGGTTWCVALPGVAEVDLQRALDWACGPGSADCTHLTPGRACFQPNTLLSHASFAFNSYYQQSGNSDIACYFGGTAVITTRDPSYGACKYLTSSDTPESTAYVHGPPDLWVGIIGIMLLFYF